MRLHLSYALTAFAVATIAAGTASAETVRGRVTQAVTRRAIPGVRVQVLGSSQEAATDTHGAFSIDVDVSSAPMLRLRHYGYEVLDHRLTAAEVALELTPRFLRLNDSVVVTAQRDPSPDLDVPRSVSTIEAEELDRTAPRTVPEALQEMNGVFVQKTNHGGGSPIIRGLVGNHVLVLVDGIRLNNSTFRYGPNQYLATVDPYSAGRVEVVRGLGSVLYGSDALGGVVNVLTERPALSPDGPRVSGRLSPKLVSSDMEKSSRLEAQASGRNVGVRGGVSLRDFGELRAGGGLGVESPSGYDEQDADARALVRLSPRHLLHMSYQHVHQDDVPRFDQVAQRGFARHSFDPQIRQLGYLQLESSFDSPWIQHLRITPSFHRSSEQRVRQQRGATVEVTEKDVVETRGLVLETRTRLGAGWTLVSGAEHYGDEVRSGRHDLDLATGALVAKRGLYPDAATAAANAVFAHSTLDRPRFVAELGLRFSTHRVEAADKAFGDLRLTNRAWVGSGAATWKLSARHRLYAAVSQGFRAPNVDDVSTLGAFDFGVETPSTALRPERTVTYEAGFKARTSRLAGTLAVYRTNLADLIDRVPSTYQGSDQWEGQRVYRRENVGRAFVRGAEGELEWQVGGRVVLFGNATYTYGQQITIPQPMRRIPPLYGHVGFRWQAARGGSLSATLAAAGRQDRLAEGDKADHRIARGGTPGWMVLNWRAAYPVTAAIDVVGGLENVFDEAYRMHGSGIDGYGRHAWLAAHLRF